MQKNLFKLGLAATFALVAPAADAQVFDPYFQSLPARAEPAPQIQVATPEQPPIQVAPQPQRPATQPSMSAAPRSMQNYAATGLNSFYGSVPHTTKGGEFEIWQTFGSGSFMFRSAAESILRWDEASTTTTNISFTKDFMLRNRQLVFNAQYGSGSFTTSRTSDDDVFNELHLMSLGKGKADLSSYQASIGLRNAWRWAGFDITPVVGYKKKVQDMKMSDHFAPAPFFYFIGCDIETGECDPIDLSKHVPDGYTVDDMFSVYIDLGNDKRTYIKFAEESDAYTIPTEALGYGMLIPAEDFCWWDMNNDRWLCLDAEIEYPDDYTNLRDSALMDAFGGMSQLVGSYGVSQMYKASWAGPFVALNLERMLSPVETLNLYAELFFPSYNTEAVWPNREEFAQPEINGVPSFKNHGGSAMGYLLEAKYKYRINQQVGIFAGLSYEEIKVRNADETLNVIDEDGYLAPEFYSGEIRVARWKNTAWSIGLSYKF